MAASDSLTVQMAGSEWFTSRPGGLNRYFQDLFLALSALQDVEVTAEAFGPPPAASGRAITWGAPGAPLPRRILRSRRTEKPRDRVDILDRHFALYGPSARRLHAGAEVVHFQGPWARESAIAGGSNTSVRLKRAIERGRYQRADRFVVLSAPFAEILSDDYRIDRSRISIIPPGVDLARFSFSTRSDGIPVVLCVRRLERRMGIDVLIRAWRAVSAAVPDAQLHIVGTGTAEAELRTLAEHSGSVVFRGRLSDSDLKTAYRDSRFTVVPSTALEGFGLIALESLAMGRAPIVTDCGGLPDAVRDLQQDLIVEKNQAEELADRITRALTSDDLPGPEMCRAHASRFAWPVIAARHVALYTHVRNDAG